MLELASETPRHRLGDVDRLGDRRVGRLGGLGAEAPVVGPLRPCHPAAGVRLELARHAVAVARRAVESSVPLTPAGRRRAVGGGVKMRGAAAVGAVGIDRVRGWRVPHPPQDDLAGGERHDDDPQQRAGVATIRLGAFGISGHRNSSTPATITRQVIATIAITTRSPPGIRNGRGRSGSL